MSHLLTPQSIQKLQKTLHAKAKAEPEYRFYALYDKIYRQDILTHAYACCKSNKGAAGLDGQTFEDIEKYGQERWLGELAQALKEGTYKPKEVKRTFIQKANGQQRPLSIPNITDRVCQIAAMLVLEPIFEADLQPEQYAYRPGKNALEAVNHVHKLLNLGYVEVVDADLAGYYDSIPHQELMRSIARRIIDSRLLHLIKMWIKAPVAIKDERSHKYQIQYNWASKLGISQGSPISPLLSNIYMRRFIVGWKKLGIEEKYQAYVVNYADDLVICCKEGSAVTALEIMRTMMAKLKLQVNEEKTHITHITKGQVNFLGYTLGRQYSSKTGRAYIGSKPSNKSIAKFIKTISLETDCRSYGQDAKILVKNLNYKLLGWSQYFKLGSVSKAYKAIDDHTKSRLRQWLCKKHKGKTRGYKRYPNRYLYQELGMIELPKLTKSLPWAKA